VGRRRSRGAAHHPQAAGANIIETIERVKALLPALARTISPSIDVKVTLDRSLTIRSSVADVQLSLILSVALVTLVVFLFLRSARATAIPRCGAALAHRHVRAHVPARLQPRQPLADGAHHLHRLRGDDAIVVTENVTRFIELGDSPMEAAFKGAKQIGFTIVSITRRCWRSSFPSCSWAA